MTTFNVRIPGLRFTIVQADGQNVMPVEIDEFQIGVAETSDAIVNPTEDKAFTGWRGHRPIGHGTRDPRAARRYDGPRATHTPTSDRDDARHGHGTYGRASGRERGVQ